LNIQIPLESKSREIYSLDICYSQQMFQKKIFQWDSSDIVITLAQNTLVSKLHTQKFNFAWSARIVPIGCFLIITQNLIFSRHQWSSWYPFSFVKTVTLLINQLPYQYFVPIQKKFNNLESSIIVVDSTEWSFWNLDIFLFSLTVLFDYDLSLANEYKNILIK